MSEWSVYIIEATDGSLYTGISTDPARRFEEHLSGQRGAKYFAGRTPRQFVFIEPNHNRGSASRREYEIKRMSKRQKLNLIRSAPPA